MIDKLRAINYVIPKSCGVCVYGKFANRRKVGYCGKFQLEIYEHGGCPNGEIRQDVKEGSWGNLVDRRKFARSDRHKAKVRY